jgi:CRP-like cAMP-binding protein
MRTRSLISKLEQFTELSAVEKQALEDSTGDIREFAAKEDIIEQGDSPDDLHLLVEGWASRYKILADGTRQIMAYLIPGDLCDVHVTLLERMDHSIGALSPCKVLFIPRHRLANLMRKHENVSRALWWSTLVDEAILREWLVNIGRRRADKRLGHLICEMLLRARAVGLTDDGTFEMPLTQEELADTMGMTPQHMNRCFQMLRAERLISTRGKLVTIHELEKLVSFSDFDPLYLHQEGNRVAVGRNPRAPDAA